MIALIAAIGFGFAALVASVPGVSAQDAGSLIIGVSACPEGYDGENYAADCTSRGDGLVTFSLAPFDLDPSGPDRVSVGEPLEFTCETIDFEPGGPLLGISFDVETGDQIACEWYNIPQPVHAGDDGDDEVGELPNTGAGVDPSGGDRFGGWPGMALLLALTGGAAYGLRRRVVA